MKLYKAFAVITLVSAPLIVLITENFAAPPEQPSAPAMADPITPAPAPASPLIATPQPPPMMTGSVPDPASFSQPMPDAGKPFLAPGAGLPGDPVTETAPDAEASPEPSPEG